MAEFDLFAKYFVAFPNKVPNQRNSEFWDRKRVRNSFLCGKCRKYKEKKKQKFNVMGSERWRLNFILIIIYLKDWHIQDTLRHFFLRLFLFYFMSILCSLFRLQMVRRKNKWLCKWGAFCALQSSKLDIHFTMKFQSQLDSYHFFHLLHSFQSLRLFSVCMNNNP